MIVSLELLQTIRHVLFQLIWYILLLDHNNLWLVKAIHPLLLLFSSLLGLFPLKGIVGHIAHEIFLVKVDTILLKSCYGNSFEIARIFVINIIVIIALTCTFPDVVAIILVKIFDVLNAFGIFLLFDIFFNWSYWCWWFPLLLIDFVDGPLLDHRVNCPSVGVLLLIFSSSFDLLPFGN